MATEELRRLQAWGAPFKGMDAREVRDPASPHMLVNVQITPEGVIRERPGFKSIRKLTGRIVGMHYMRVEDRSGLVVIVANNATSSMNFAILNASGNEVVGAFSLTTPTDVTVPAEPYDAVHYYSFQQAGRFLYFCNGYGNLYEMEWLPGSVKLQGFPFETGFAPKVLSYFQGNLKPTSFDYFYSQLIMTGFQTRVECPLSNPLYETQNIVPESLLGLSRDSMFISIEDVLVSEPGLFRSFPVEDASGFYRFWNADGTIATKGIGTNLFVFTRRGIYGVSGHGSQSPKQTWISDHVLVSPRAVVEVGGGLMFVAATGIHTMSADGQTRKVSSALDPLWFGTQTPEVTRFVAYRLAGFPFFVNRQSLRNTVAQHNARRRHVYFSVPRSGASGKRIVFVYDYSGAESGVGEPRWCIWAGGDSGTALDWTCMAQDPGGDGEFYAGTEDGYIGRLYDRTYDVLTSTIKPYDILVGFGRVGRSDDVGRPSYRAVRVRKKQTYRNTAEESTAPVMAACTRMEAEGMRWKSTDTYDPERQVLLDNAQKGTSEAVTAFWGGFEWDDTTPWLGPEYHDFFGKVEMVSEESRAVVLDLYEAGSYHTPPAVGGGVPAGSFSPPVVIGAPGRGVQPHRLDLSEVALHGKATEGRQTGGSR